MKIQCDVCDKVEALVFCPADEAALCHSCDRTIHHANKLATKHARFSLHYPTSKDFPLCDICQERRAYLFCQEDRALLCRECDFPIHRANEHTQKHNRFLLTGVKLSGTSLDPASSSTNCTTASEGKNARSKMNRPRSVSNENASSSCKVDDNVASDTGSVSTSSISEYLIETLPGYCFEDFIDASFAPNGFCKKQKNYNHHGVFFQDQDLEVRSCLVGVKEIPKVIFVSKGIRNGGTMCVPFPKLVINSSKNLDALDDQLFVKNLLENIFVFCYLHFFLVSAFFIILFFTLYSPTTVLASLFCYIYIYIFFRGSMLSLI